MSKRFLKLNLDTQEADFLAIHHPNAFLLLYFIARRARRISGKPDGLHVGECQIGDWENMGMSRQNYRTALKVLCVKKFVQILETNRTRKKSTTGLTTEGTKVKLLNSVIWDINSEEPNHRPNHCLTTAQPLPNHEQERKRKVKKEEEEYIPTSIATSLLSDFFSSLFSSIPDFPKDKAKKTKSQYQAADRLLKNYSIEIIKAVINYAHDPSGFWIYHVHSLTYLEKKFVTLQQQLKNPNFGKKHEANRGYTQGSPESKGEPKFQASRVLRGGNRIQGDKGVLHE